jgi:hypothetical protein
MKTAILVLTHNEWPYDMMEKCIRETWGKQQDSNVKTYYSVGFGPNMNLHDDTIYAPYPEGYENIGYKTLFAFEFLLSTDFDFLFRPNTSSFVNIHKLNEFVKTIPTEKYYGGSPIPFNGGGVMDSDRPDGPTVCGSGCGFILSRDLVQLIVDNKDKWEHRLIDDLALCKFLNDFGVKMNKCPRVSVHYTENGEVYSFGRKLTTDEILNEMHYTTRTGEIRLDIENPREHSCEIIKTLYNIVYED